MARVKLEVPEKIIASFIVPVRIGDINYGNHVGNDAFVAVIHDARMQWLREHGFTELDIEGPGLIMADLAIEFKGEAFYGDNIEIKLSAGEITAFAFELFYQLFTIRNEKNILLAKAKTGMICYDYEKKKIAAMSPILKEMLGMV